jgi:hypothetical protein
MALELLAGPFTVRDADDNTISVSEDVGGGPVSQYDDLLGLVVYSDLGGYCTVQLDGVAHLRSAAPRANLYLLDLTTLADWIFVEGLFMDKAYGFDRKAGTFDFDGLILDAPGVAAGFSGIRAMTADRWLGATGPQVRAWPLDLSDTYTVEATLSGAPASGIASFSRYKKSTQVCLIYRTGEVLFYDFESMEQLTGKAYVGANNGAWYSPKYDVFVVLTGTTTNAVSIFASRPRPASITDPVATAVTKGHVSTVAVSVLGADDEPCPGEVIEWSIDGPGYLSAARSTTDDDGVAEVLYAAPFATSPSPTITATLRF